MDFESYLSHLATNRMCSQQTVRAYRSDLKQFAVFASEHGIAGLDQVDHVRVRQYIEHMRSKPNPRFVATGLSDASIARRLAALSGYFEFIRATDIHTLRNPLKDLSNRWKKDRDPKPVDEETLGRLLAGITNARDRFLFSLFLSTDRKSVV